MRKVIGVLLVGVIPFVFGPTIAAQAHASHPSIVRAHVKIVNFKFKPGVLSIQKGTKVSLPQEKGAKPKGASRI